MGDSRIELDVMGYIYGYTTNIIQQYVGLSENWVYPQNSILFMGDVMVNQWIDKYPYPRGNDEIHVTCWDASVVFVLDV